MEKTALKKITLCEKHIKLGAKMVPFAGYLMPLQYEGINIEHLNVRNNVGIFDVSHMGEFIIKGKNAKNLVQYISSNDVNKLFDGKVQYSCLTNDKGGIVDDLLIYRLNENEYMLVVNASNIEKDWNWIISNNKWKNVEIKNISDTISLLAVQGPNSINVLQLLTNSVDLSKMKYYTFVKTKFAGVDDIIISATGYTGAGGFEIYVKNKDAEKVWDAIMKAGNSFKIKAAGLGARDTLRLEMGFCLYGNDINDESTPLEAGLSWITKLNTEFIGSDFLRRQKEKGIKRKLVGFVMNDKGIPRKGYIIKNEKMEIIGKVTSGTMSPILKKGIGLGYIDINYSKEGAFIFIEIREKNLPAHIKKPPFIHKNQS